MKPARAILLFALFFGVLGPLGCAAIQPVTDESLAAASTSERPPKESVAKDHLICEWVESTGSHLRERVCKTSEQADAEREESQRNVQTNQRYNMVAH